VKCRALSAFEKVGKLLSIVKVSKQKGIGYVVQAGTRKICNELSLHSQLIFNKLFRPARTFTFQGDTYRNFYHVYNKTWENERTVETPIIWEMVKKYSGKNILEVGNVLSHYFSVRHDIVDKYEKLNGVINQDIIDFQPSKKYDLVISISTLEHAGWDEKPRDPMKIPRAIEHLKGLLAEAGKIVVTLPLGYNPELDKLLRQGKIQFSKKFFLKRISKDNRWEEVSWKDVCNSKYGEPFPCANALVIGILE